MKKPLARKLPSAITLICNFRSGVRYILSYTIKKIIFCLGLSIFLSLILSPFLLRAQIKSPPGSVKVVKYTSQDLRDPFQSPFEIGEQGPAQAAVEIRLPSLEVQGMVWDSKMPQAIINNIAVKVGEVIECVEILYIRRAGVYVLYQ